MFGLHISNVRLYGGQVKILGLDAVAAEFSQATLERRGDDGSGNPIWTLHAVLSYQFDLLLANEGFIKKFLVEPWKGKIYEAIPIEGVEPKMEDGHLIIEGVTLVRTEGNRD